MYHKDDCTIWSQYHWMKRPSSPLQKWHLHLLMQHCLWICNSPHLRLNWPVPSRQSPCHQNAQLSQDIFVLCTSIRQITCLVHRHCIARFALGLQCLSTITLNWIYRLTAKKKSLLTQNAEFNLQNIAFKPFCLSLYQQ